jgi:hypothetical protein
MPITFLGPGASMPGALPRRHVLKRLAACAAALVAMPSGVAALHWLEPRHPTPRPGIDGSRVLRASELTDAPHLTALFDHIREISHIADGIRCYCGCAGIEGYRSLLSCYEGVGMAKWCEICQGEGQLAHRRWKEGQSLEQIRRAIDARYGHGSASAGGQMTEAQHCHG